MTRAHAPRQVAEIKAAASLISHALTAEGVEEVQSSAYGKLFGQAGSKATRISLVSVEFSME